MRAHVRPRRLFLGAAAVCALAVLSADAATKPRTLLILPYAMADLGRDEQWVGEGVAQSLALAFVQMPSFIQIDRERLKRLPRPEAWDDQAALSAARAVGAELTLYGEVKRSGSELAIQPRYLEAKGDKSERVALDVMTVPEGTLMERLRDLPLAYSRALKVSLTDTEAARAKKAASPTTSQRAFEAFVGGQQAAYRGGQEGNEAAVELLGKAIEIDPQFVAAQYM